MLESYRTVADTVEVIERAIKAGDEMSNDVTLNLMLLGWFQYLCQSARERRSCCISMWIEN